MRALTLVLLAACAKPTPPPAPAPVLHPLPLPPYGGAERVDDCLVFLHPADDAERAARLAAMRSRLPPGTQIELDELGVRPRRIVLPSGAGPAPKRKPAAALAERFLRDTAELWGTKPPAQVGVEDEADDTSIWVAYISLPPEPLAVWEHDDVRIAIVIDRKTGRLAAGEYGPSPDPYAEICAKPSAPPDDDFRHAVAAQYPDEDLHALKPPAYEYYREWDDWPIVRLAVAVAGTHAVYAVDPNSRVVIRRIPYVIDRYFSPNDEIEQLQKLVH